VVGTQHASGVVLPTGNENVVDAEFTEFDDEDRIFRVQVSCAKAGRSGPKCRRDLSNAR
jgi:hypothetical protein